MTRKKYTSRQGTSQAKMAMPSLGPANIFPSTENTSKRMAGCFELRNVRLLVICSILKSFMEQIFNDDELIVDRLRKAERI